MANDAQDWLMHALGQLIEAAFGAGSDVMHRDLAMVLVITMIAVPCALLVVIGRAGIRAVRRSIAEAEALYPMDLEGIEAEPTASGRVEDRPPLEAMSLKQLDAAIGVAERRVRHALAIRGRDKERRKHSTLLWLVDAVFLTRYAVALDEATKHHKKLETHARRCARAWVERRMLALATATPELAAQHRQLVGAVDDAAQQSNLTSEWVRRASDARDAMLDAKRWCNSASSSEFFDVVLPKNKMLSVMSWSDTTEARRHVDKAKRAVDALRRSLPAQGRALALDTRIHVPDAFIALMVDIYVSPTFDVLSLFNSCALGEAAKKCGRAADALARFGGQARALAGEASAQLQAATAAKAMHEAPFIRVARGELPRHLQALAS